MERIYREMHAGNNMTWQPSNQENDSKMENKVKKIMKQCKAFTQ